MQFDWIIRNGSVIDGTGSSAKKADVGILNDKIEAIGDLSKAVATKGAINAEGKLVTPGFVDVHSHSDTYVLLERNAPSKLAQGVTTEINGQCGGSAAPLFGEAHLSSDWASMTYPKNSGTPGATWRTFAEYRELVEEFPASINTIQFVGHNTLRAGVLGYADKKATNDDLRLLKYRLEEALDFGAWGMTTGLLYQPGRYATSEEVESLAETVAKYNGMYATHMRSESVRLLEAVDEVIQLATRTGVKTEISHLKTSGKSNWGKIDALLDKLEDARNTGMHLYSDRYPYIAAGTDLDIVFPDWAIEGGREAELARLANTAQRQQIESELDSCGRDWSLVRIGGGWSDLTKQFCGKTIAEAACSLKLSPGQTVCAFVAEDLTRTGAFFFGMSEDNLRKILAKPWVMPGSDASLRAPWGVLGQDFPHPRAYGTMPKFFRMLTGKDDNSPLCPSKEEAIYRMTGLCAKAFGLYKRGILAEGYFADIAVWDENNFCDKSTYDNPHQFASGMDFVFVNGRLAYDNGKFMDAFSGRLLAPGK